METRVKIDRMGYGIRKRLPVLLLFFLIMLPLTACGGEENGTKVIFTTGMGKDEVFRIGGSVCTAPEMMVYLTNTQNQYESVYGPEVWNVSRDGITLEENVKETGGRRILRFPDRAGKGTDGGEVFHFGAALQGVRPGG